MSEKEADILKKETQILKLHYYFNDNSHSMDAFKRNKMEKDFLDFISELGNALDINIVIESQSRKEGGLVEVLAITIPVVAGIASILKPSINNVITHYATRQHKNQELDRKFKEEQIKKLKLENKDKELEILRKYEDVSENLKIRRNLSNFYQKAENCEKIERIGYEYDGYKRIVQRNEFKNFILDSKSDIEVIEDTRIEIISPVLKEGKYKWKGIYENNKIDFSMRDSGFKKDVINQKYNFTNGSIIVCKLEIKNTYDEFGEKVKNTTYRVMKVYEVIVNNNIRKTKAGQKRDKDQFDSKQKSLFDED